MIQYLKEYGKYVEITGFRNVEFSRAEEFLKANRKEKNQDTCIQFFNAELVATSEHLNFAVLNALEAFKNNTNISKSLAMETMLYASAQRQIQKSIQLLGINPKSADIALVIIGENFGSVKKMLQAVTEFLNAKPDDTALKLTSEKTRKIKQTYEITNQMLKTVTEPDSTQALVNLVIERVALLATQL